MAPLPDPRALAASWIGFLILCGPAHAGGGSAAGRPDPAIASVTTGEPSTTCLAHALTTLGWRLEAGEAAMPEVMPGQPCERDSLADAHARGDLRLRLSGDQARDAAQARALLGHPASHCAYALRLGEATRRAVDRLVQNRRFRFSSLQTGWIGFGMGGARRDGWEPIRSFGRGFRPSTTPSAAIEGFYSGSVRAECGVGRQIAQYATVYELFGPHDFDAGFARDEIVIGTFNQLHTTSSILLGHSAGAFTRDGRGILAASQGRQAWNGLPGFIVHVFDRRSLDDVNNQAENFVVYRVSPAAAQALRLHGGFDHYNRQSRQLWTLARRSGLSAQRIFERLLYERDAALRAAISPETRRLVGEMEAILADPFFQGFEIYVHPKGVRPAAYHFARLLDRNPRTPFRIELALHNLHTTLYARWIDRALRECRPPG